MTDDGTFLVTRGRLGSAIYQATAGRIWAGNAAAPTVAIAAPLSITLDCPITQSLNLSCPVSPSITISCPVNGSVVLS
jgi:hypothetical protein